MRHCFEQPDLPLRAFVKALGKHRPATLEGGKGGSAPSAPDPNMVASATTQTNEQTAAYNKALNLNNYSNPFGSQQSYVSGYDSSGAPIYQTNISASGGLQNLISQSMGQAGNSAGVVNSSLFGLGGLNSQYSGLNSQLQGLGGQISPTAAQDANTAGRNAAYSAQTQYLDPQFSQGQTSLESQLANQGLTPGSQAYTNAMTNFNNAKQQAYSNASNQSILTGSQIGAQMLNNQLASVGTQAGLIGQQGQTLGAQGANYGQMASLSQIPYSNLGSLASLVPGNTGTSQSAAAPANIAQAFQNQYAGQLNAYNANMQSANSTQSGLFGLGTAGMMALALSDRHAKADVEPTGERLVTGLPVYRFRYRGDAPNVRRTGVMADEVRQFVPEAVMTAPDGFDRVDYSKIGGVHLLPRVDVHGGR